MRTMWSRVTTLSLAVCFLMLVPSKSVQAQCNIGVNNLGIDINGADAWNENGCGVSSPQTGPAMSAGSTLPVRIHADGISGAGSYATVQCTAYSTDLGIYTNLFSTTTTTSIDNLQVYWTPTVAGTYTLSCSAYYNIPYGSGNTGMIYTGNIYVPVT
jgi:hypothetical protein